MKVIKDMKYISYCISHQSITYRLSSFTKSNISNTFTFDEGTSDERNQSSPYVTYSTLVFMYEWKQNMDKRGKLIN